MWRNRCRTKAEQYIDRSRATEVMASILGEAGLEPVLLEMLQRLPKSLILGGRAFQFLAGGEVLGGEVRQGRDPLTAHPRTHGSPVLDQPSLIIHVR